MPAKLFLLPVPISQNGSNDWIGADYHTLIKETTLYFVENVRTARRFISSLKLGIQIDSLRFEVLDKNTTETEIKNFGNLISTENKAIVMSESGCPGVADPGSKLVGEAHRLGVEILPVVGPSSILLALMGSGLSGQNFCFHGYLPIESKERSQSIRQLETESQKRNQTQIFIETPYRNQNVWKALLSDLKPETRLAFARDLQGDDQKIVQKRVAAWRQTPDIEWNKSPTIFLFQA